MAFEVGSDVESMCNSCGDVWHIVIAKVGEKITKVECKQCGKRHRFRPTGDAPAANLAPPKRSASKRPRRRVAAAEAPSVALDPGRPTRRYALSERFALDEQIEHAKFGRGVVCEVEPNKIRVRFPGGIKTLMHGKAS